MSDLVVVRFHGGGGSDKVGVALVEGELGTHNCGEVVCFDNDTVRKVCGEEQGCCAR